MRSIQENYAYAGFPRSLNAIAAFMGALDQRKAKGIEDGIGNAVRPLRHAT